jgi:anti-sigma factor RsiW
MRPWPSLTLIAYAATMKTHLIDIHKFKSASNSSHGTVAFRVDAQVSPQAQKDDGTEPATTLLMSEASARVLMALLKTQLAAFDGRKARSQR